MFKKVSAHFIYFFAAISFAVCLLFFTPCLAASTRSNLESTASKIGYQTTGTKAEITENVQNVVGAILSLIAIIFFVLLVYAGILWMTAQGNEEKVTKAKNIMITAVIGLFLVLSAYAISNFVLNKMGITSASANSAPPSATP